MNGFQLRYSIEYCVVCSMTNISDRAFFMEQKKAVTTLSAHVV
ncbi:MAG: hypothetical protein Q8R26_03845 [bacterium]|nr:hypothetical protein [bacterium]